jgi:hypothetical protein
MWDGVKWTSVLSAGGPFLPLAGGSMTGPLNYTATGGTTLRSAQDRAVEGISVKDFGAIGNGVADDGAAFAAALTAIASGGAIVVPSGTYNIGRALTQAVTGSVAFIGAGSGVTLLNFTAATDGLTLSLGPNSVAQVSGMTIVRAPSSGTTYANTGLTITSPADPSLRLGKSNVRDISFTGGAYFWATGISIYNTVNVSIDHIAYTAPNATGTNVGVGVGILIAGKSATSYLTEAKVNDVITQGGSVGLQIGDWVQGVYVDQSAFIGNDYGIRWSGVAGHGNLWLAVCNTHFNSGSCGVLSDIADSAQIVNTYTLHFNIPSVDGTWQAVKLHNAQPGLISNNSIYCSGPSSTSAVEQGILILGGSNVTIVGNIIYSAKNVGIYVNATNTLIASNIFNLGSGIPSVQYAAIDPSNQMYGNQRNGVPDITVDQASGALIGGNGNGSPTFTTRSIGTRFILKPTLSGTATDVAMGYDAGAFWFSLPQVSTGANFVFYGGTTPLVYITDGGLIYSNGYGVGVNPVIGPRINGWGTSTGGVRGAITGSSTLPQVAAALSQLLTDLKTHGMIGT